MTKLFKLKQHILFFFLIAFTSGVGVVNAAEAKKTSFPKVAQVSVELLENEGDYYLHPNGQRIEFKRKKNVYALKETGAAKSFYKVQQQSTLSRLKERYGSEQIKEIKSHRLGKTMLIRVLETRSKNKNKSGRVDAAPSLNALRKAQTSGVEIIPVLANSKGTGDILISHHYIVKFNNTPEIEQALQQLSQRFNLRLQRQVNVAGDVYSFSAPIETSVSERFALARQIADHSLVDWAQPQFVSKPVKHTFKPLDPLYQNQWHLQNNGYQGSLCDTDCDANNAWDIGNANGVGAVSGANTVIAVIDDGIQMDHEDLTLWQNSGEVGACGLGCDKRTNGIDDDGNGFIDDWQGWDFVDDSETVLRDPNNVTLSCPNANDGDLGTDNDPSPQVFTDCVTVSGDDILQDDHGTAVAGIAAAKQGNALGGVGVAFSASLLAIRLISDFDSDDSNDFCMRAAEAITYAGRYADVVNNSWGIDEGTCPLLDTVIEAVIDGTIMLDLTDDMTNNPTNESKRPNLGSPIIFATGNSASGWVKVTVSVDAGNHAYEWRFLRSGFPNDFESPNFIGEDQDKVWLDDIVFPSGDRESFESDLSAFNTGCAVNNCTLDCDGLDVGDLPSCPDWAVNNDPEFVLQGSQSAVSNQSASVCTYSYLTIERSDPAGEISFWVWVGTDQQIDSDKFEFLIDGQEVTSFGDLPQVVDDSVGYPASLTKVIAVGASNSGGLIDGDSSISDLNKEERAHYSQYGDMLDVLAPSSNQHLQITTTDRHGPDGYDPSSNYTNTFGGTSAAAPIVSGIAATMIAMGNDYNGVAVPITAAQIETILRASADKIGRLGASAYDQDSNQRSEYYGYGRVNMYRSLSTVINGVTPNTQAPSCSTTTLNYDPALDPILTLLSPQPTEFCPGVPFQSDSLCISVEAINGNIAVFCL